MKAALIALVLGMFTVSVAVHANEGAAPEAEKTTTAKRTKKTKHKKDGSTEVEKAEKTTTEESADTPPTAE